MKKMISLLLIILVVCSVITGCFLDSIIGLMSSTSSTSSTTISTTKKTIDYSEIEWEEKRYWQGDITHDFEPGVVLLTMDKAISEPGKIFEKEFFVGVEIETIIDYSFSPSPNNIFRQLLILILKEKTKEAVMDAIEKLEKIDGIISAEPNVRVYWE